METIEFEVEIRETVTITSTEHETTILPFGPLDQFAVPYNDVPGIWFYEEMLDYKQLQESLTRVVAHLPHLCGQLIWNENGTTDLIQNNKGIPFVFAFAPKVSINDFNIKTTSSSPKEFLKLTSRVKTDATNPIVSIQLTQFENGGCSLSVSGQHCVFDGAVLFNFFSLWSKEHRQASPQYLFEFDNSILYKEEENSLPVETPRPNNFKLSEQTEEELKEGFAKIMESIPTSEFFIEHYNLEEINELKQSASKSLPPNSYVTTNDVITSHLWKVFAKLRNFPPKENSKMLNVCNLREKKPSIPPHYFRNCALTIHTNATGEELANTPLSTLAPRVHAEIHSYRNQYVDQDLQLLNNIATRNPSLKGVNFEVDLFGNDIWFSSWASFPVYDADFGKGKPVWFHTPCLVVPNTWVILPAPPKMGGVIVIAMLNSSVKQAFKK